MSPTKLATRVDGCREESKMPERTLWEGKVAVHQLPSFFQPEPEPPLRYSVFLLFELDQLEAEAVRDEAPRWDLSSHCFFPLE